MRHGFWMLSILIALFLLSGMATAHTVTINFAIRIGSDTGNTIHVNDTDYDTTTPVSLTFVNMNKKYMSANRTTTLAALVSAGTLLSARLNNTYNSTHYLMQMTQDSSNNRFLLAATNGTFSSVEDKLNMVETARMVSSTFGRFAIAVPRSFSTFIRLEYTDIDITSRAFWSGVGKLLIKNRGLTSRNIPNITIEAVI